MRLTSSIVFIFIVTLISLSAGSKKLIAQGVVPGTGQKFTNVGDDFEDEKWGYTRNGAKSTYNINKQINHPTGFSSNKRWFESSKRGHPDIIKRVATPAGGIKGSKGSLLMRSFYSGIPRSPSFKMQQDDFLLDINGRLGGYLPVAWSPNCVVRVYLPPFEQWENRTGTSFGLRTGVRTHRWKKNTGFFASGGRQVIEPYWPGMFISFHSETDADVKKDYAQIIIRGNENGFDVPSTKITKTGWWTLGMSFTQDGKIHYYAKPGVENLTKKDHLGSYYPYGFRCEKFSTFFFNVANMDDGRTWSTPWVIDDPSLYFVRPQQAIRKAQVQR